MLKQIELDITGGVVKVVSASFANRKEFSDVLKALMEFYKTQPETLREREEMIKNKKKELAQTI